MTQVPSLSQTACLSAVRTLLHYTEDVTRELHACILQQLREYHYAAVSEMVLRTLAADHPSRLNNELLVALAPPFLKQLQLKGCGSVSAVGLEQVFRRCRQLQVLDLSECEHLMQPIFFKLCGRAAPSLTSLCLEDCSTVTDDVVKSILKNMKQLKHLSLSLCSDITDNVFLIDEHFQISRETQAKMQRSGKDIVYPCSLTSVDVSGCRSLTSTAIRHLTSLCGPSLMAVNLSMTNIDCTALWYLSGYSLSTAVQLAMEVDRLQLDTIAENGVQALTSRGSHQNGEEDEITSELGVDDPGALHRAADVAQPTAEESAEPSTSGTMDKSLGAGETTAEALQSSECRAGNYQEVSNSHSSCQQGSLEGLPNDHNSVKRFSEECLEAEHSVLSNDFDRHLPKQEENKEFVDEKRVSLDQTVEHSSDNSSQETKCSLEESRRLRSGAFTCCVERNLTNHQSQCELGIAAQSSPESSNGATSSQVDHSSLAEPVPSSTDVEADSSEESGVRDGSSLVINDQLTARGISIPNECQLKSDSGSRDLLVQQTKLNVDSRVQSVFPDSPNGIVFKTELIPYLKVTFNKWPLDRAGFSKVQNTSRLVSGPSLCDKRSLDDESNEDVCDEAGQNGGSMAGLSHPPEHGSAYSLALSSDDLSSNDACDISDFVPASNTNLAHQLVNTLKLHEYEESTLLDESQCVVCECCGDDDMECERGNGSSCSTGQEPLLLPDMTETKTRRQEWHSEAGTALCNNLLDAEPQSITDGDLAQRTSPDTHQAILFSSQQFAAVDVDTEAPKVNKRCDAEDWQAGQSVVGGGKDDTDTDSCSGVALRVTPLDYCAVKEDMQAQCNDTYPAEPETAPHPRVDQASGEQYPLEGQVPDLPQVGSVAPKGSPSRKLTGLGSVRIAKSRLDLMPRLEQLYKPRLQSVELHNISFHSKDLGSACLKALLLTNHHIYKFGISWKELDDDMAEFIGQYAPDLQYLSLVDCDLLTTYGVANICMKCPKLKKLNLQGVCFISDPAVIPVIAKKSIHTLNLSETNITDITLKYLARNCAQQLGELHLSWCEEISEMGLNAMLETCSCLHTLQMRQCPTSEMTFALLTQTCTNLRDLNLSSVNGLTDAILVTMAASLKHLEKLDISWNCALTDEGMCPLLAYSSNLQELVSAGIKQISSAAFLPIISEAARWRRCQALLRLKLQERKVLQATLDDPLSSSDEELDEICLPARSTSYVPRLRSLDLEYCDRVDDHHLAEIVAVCRGTLRVNDYYGQDLKATWIRCRRGKVFLAP